MINTKETFAVWLLTARKDDGDYYTENTQGSYINALNNSCECTPFCWDLSLAEFERRLLGITESAYYSNLSKSRQGDLKSALKIYAKYLHDRENGWVTIAEFSQGRQFTYTHEFSLHVTYDTPFTVKELSEFLKGFDRAFKGMLIEQGVSPSEAHKMDMTIAKVSEGSLWFEIFSAVATVAIPIVELVVKRWLQKHDKKDCNCDVKEKE